MISARKLSRAILYLLPLLFFSSENIFAQNYEEDAPEVTARTARVSFLKGDVQIRRADQTDWERAVNNLPLVEGDEIVTNDNARLEIQFNSASYLRLSENARLKITTLRDEGIAVSLPNGMMSVRILSFDKDRSYFEMDAPSTTVSVERAGMYRIDAGSERDTQVRVAVTESGQARVYSENSGFTLKNGRSATVQLEGNYAGEWETSEASRYADDFDSWALERDAVIAKRLRDADYDKYYDRDFYGAEDLDEYGEWVHTRKYGYVWKPFRNSIANYSDWSPYRYGQWRWIPVYGWTWVNDEPWGYATYHYGRWVYVDNYWHWSPYGQIRGRRSWWRPALVVISYIGDNICWYPLPYHYGYYNYNGYYYNNYRRRRNNNTTIINNNTTVVVVNPTPTPAPNPSPTPLPEWEMLLPGSVVATAASEFGRNKVKFQTANTDLAKEVLSSNPVKTTRPLILPTYKDLSGNISKDIQTAPPKILRNEANIKTGAAVRTSGVSTGETLRNEKILGNRPPVGKTPPRENEKGTEQTPIRNTGAITRPPRVENGNQNPVRQPSTKDVSPNDDPIRDTGGIKSPQNQNQTPVKPNREREIRQSPPPVYTPPPRIPREEKVERPRTERQPERQPEPVRPTPPPRVERPQRIEPRPQPPRQEPPRQEPPRQEPKQEKPSAPADPGKGRQKDG